MIGLVWGALQALFGIVAAVAAIPGIVEFIEFLVAKIGQGGFWDAVWALIVFGGTAQQFSFELLDRW